MTTVAAPLLTCEGCGETFPDPRPPTRRGQRMGRTPKWCSERCRKRTLYAGTCVDCGGAPTNGYDGPGTASERCIPCTAAFLTQLTETARRLGLTPKGVRYRVDYARARGLTDPTKKAPRSGNSRRRDP